MKKLLKSLFLVSFFFSAFDAAAQSARITSFDDRPACEAVKGVWRHFGNGCVDECEPKLDQFSVCTQAITFGCDCGKGRCWDGETCAPMKEYKKVYAVKKAKEDKILAAAKKQREDSAKENQEEIMKVLVSKAALSIQPPDPTGKLPVKNNYSEFYKDFKPLEDATHAQLQGNQPQNPVTEIPLPPIPEAPPLNPQTGDPGGLVPLFFLQEEEKKAKEEQENQAKTQQKQSTQSPKVAEPTEPLIAEPSLPIVPLPN